MSEAGPTVEEPTLSTPAADVAHLLRRAGFEGTATEIANNPRVRAAYLGE